MESDSFEKAKRKVDVWISVTNTHGHHLMLDLRNLGLTSLPDLPDNIQRLDYSFNKLTSLPILPKYLRQLFCNNNNLISLPNNLPHNLQLLNCCFNQLTKLPNLSTKLQLLYFEKTTQFNVKIVLIQYY